MISCIGYTDQEVSWDALASDPMVSLKAGVNLEVVVVSDRPILEKTVCYFICGNIDYETEVLAEDLAVEEEDLSNWHFYPNPAREYVFIETGSKTGLLELWSMDGRLIRQQVIRSESELMEMSGLPSASYLLIYAATDREKEIIGQLLLVD